MSGLIFPTALIGRQLTLRKAPNFNTHKQKALSGKQSRISYRAYPLYEWELSFDYLSDNFPVYVARTNFVPWSQDFTQWILNHSGVGLTPVVVGNYSAAPDGTYTADRVVLNVASGTTSGDFSQIFPAGNSGPTGVCTASVWAKTNDGTAVTVRLASRGAPIIMSVTSVWQRFSVVTNNATAGLMNLELLGDGTTSKYADLSLWGAQVEPGVFATTNIMTNGVGIRVSDLKTLYGVFSQMLGQSDTFLFQDTDFNTVTLAQFAKGNASTTVFNLTATYMPGVSIPQFGAVLGNAGTPEWVQNTNGPPAIYTARWSGPELLGSAARTNLALQSNFAGSWTVGGTGATLTANSTTAPDGTTTAAKYTAGTTSGIYDVTLAQALTGGLRYAFSVWLKTSTQQFVQLSIDANSPASDSMQVVFDLVNGVAGTINKGSNGYASQADVTMTAFPNGWYRCSISGQLPAADTTIRVAILAASSIVAGFFPTITPASQAFFLWGGQLEAGTQVTALIPVTTVHVTAPADYSLTNLSTAGAVNTFQQVSFAAAPANNVQLLWSGSFFYRCGFVDDKIDFAQVVNKIWEQKSLIFEQILV